MNTPKIINNFLDDFEFKKTIEFYNNLKNSDLSYDEIRKRYVANDTMSYSILISKVELAREVFNSKTLLPTYSVFSRYVGPGATLEKHKDDNACTYTLDLCIESTSPWGLWIDDTEYILEKNQALSYYGNDQEHWREEMSGADTVSMIFLHYAEPDHWWFKSKRGK